MIEVVNAKQADKPTAVNILCQSFANDPQINWIIGEGKNKNQRLKQLMAYAFEHSLLNGKVQITVDKKAVAIWKNPKFNQMNWRLLIESIKFFYQFGFRRMKRISKMETQFGEHYPRSRDYLYLWFIGTLPTNQGKGYGSSLLNPILERFKEEKKEVYLETTTKKNVSYYQKKGFDLYNEKIIGQANQLLVYMLRTHNTH